MAVTIDDAKAVGNDLQNRLNELKVKEEAVTAALAVLDRTKAAVTAAEASLQAAEDEAIAADSAAEKVAGKLIYVLSEIGVDAEVYIPPPEPPVEPPVEPEEPTA